MLLGADQQGPVKFRLFDRSEMGLARRAGKKLGFSQAPINAIESFYGDVPHNLTPYQAKAPQIQRQRALEVAAEPLPTVELIEPKGTPQPGVAEALHRWSVDW